MVNRDRIMVFKALTRSDLHVNLRSGSTANDIKEHKKGSSVGEVCLSLDVPSNDLGYPRSKFGEFRARSSSSGGYCPIRSSPGVNYAAELDARFTATSVVSALLDRADIWRQMRRAKCVIYWELYAGFSSPSDCVPFFNLQSFKSGSQNCL
ncbi:hypothetical protein AAHC03_024263 [Spirometra sp. Aus1]